MSFLKFIDKNFKINPVGAQALIGMGIIRAANNAAALQTDTLDTANSTPESCKDYEQIFFETFFIGCWFQFAPFCLIFETELLYLSKILFLQNCKWRKNANGPPLCLEINLNCPFGFAAHTEGCRKWIRKDMALFFSTKKCICKGGSQASLVLVILHGPSQSHELLRPVCGYCGV